jgi:aryl-alcohol dehydrogenase-like predicted oxidoreductase
LGTAEGALLWLLFDDQLDILAQDFIVIPKSTSEARIQQNADVFDFELKSEDVEALDGLEECVPSGVSSASLTKRRYLVTDWDPIGDSRV